MRDLNSDEPIEFLVRPMGTDLVVGFLGGDVGKELEDKGERAAVDFAVSRLAKMYGPEVKSSLIESFVTHWGSDPFSMGAYSVALPGYQHMRQVLKKPLEDKVYFAGEATSEAWALCLPGAYETGMEVAKAITSRFDAARLKKAV